MGKKELTLADGGQELPIRPPLPTILGPPPAIIVLPQLSAMRYKDWVKFWRTKAKTLTKSYRSDTHIGKCCVFQGRAVGKKEGGKPHRQSYAAGHVPRRYAFQTKAHSAKGVETRYGTKQTGFAQSIPTKLAYSWTVRFEKIAYAPHAYGRMKRRKISHAEVKRIINEPEITKPVQLRILVQSPYSQSLRTLTVIYLRPRNQPVLTIVICVARPDHRDRELP